jgi:hypothetical protein
MRRSYNRVHWMLRCVTSADVIARELLVQAVQAGSYGLLLIQNKGPEELSRKNFKIETQSTRLEIRNIRYSVLDSIKR